MNSQSVTVEEAAMVWRQQLKGDSLAWLLEADDANPGVRYATLRDLLDRPGDDVELQEAGAAVMHSGPVPAILDAMAPDGYWVKPGGGYSPKYRSTVWQILLLAELGADPADARIRQGCEYVLNHSIASNGAFAAGSKPSPSGAIHCLNGNLIWALLQHGYADDQRLHGALDWLALSVNGDASIRFYGWGTSGPGFACGVNYGQPCGWGAAKAMRALLAVLPERRSDSVKRAIDAGAEFLLSRNPAEADYPYSDRVSSTWFKLGFPLSYWSDVLEVVDVLAQAGFGQDPRLAPAIDWVLSRQDAEGRWKLGNSLTGKMWQNIERRGQPSKWVTLRALRMLKAAQSTPADL